MTVETIEEAPRTIADSDACVIVVRGSDYIRYAHGIDKGLAILASYEHVFTRKQAEELASRIGDSAEVCPATTKDIKGAVNFWLNTDEASDGYGRFTLRIGEPINSDYERTPDWFIASMQKIAPDENWGDDGTSGKLSDAVRAMDVFWMHTTGHKWCKHQGWVGVGEGTDFVSEPYNLGVEEIKELIEDCQKFGFQFALSGESSHYPSATFRITINPIEKLTYTKPVRNIGPLRQEWENRRELIFKATIRQNCIEQIAHVAHLVKNVEPHDYEMFVDTAINTVRGYVDEVLDDAYGDVELLSQYHQLAELFLERAGEHDLDGASRLVLDALRLTLRPDSGLGGHTASTIGVYCRDAVDLVQRDSGQPAHIAESKWQQNLHKQLWEPYYAQWADDKGPEEAL
jgi:hypothetical protein